MKSANISELSELKNNVIIKMKNFIDNKDERIFSDTQISKLTKIQICFLSNNSISRHGLTTNLDKTKKISPDNCQVKLNRNLLQKEYLKYAEFVLFHEYLHCLGNFSHDKNFRQLENIWPEKKKMNAIGKELTRDLQEKNLNGLGLVQNVDTSLSVVPGNLEVTISIKNV